MSGDNRLNNWIEARMGYVFAAGIFVISVILLQSSLAETYETPPTVIGAYVMTVVAVDLVLLVLSVVLLTAEVFYRVHYWFETHGVPADGE